MKSLKFFAALAMPVVFAACTSEELYTSEANAPQSMEEVVGTNLLGTDLSLDFSTGVSVESRLVASTGNWEETDLLGLGWLVNNGGVDKDQLSTQAPTNSKLYNNVRFGWNEDEKRFTANAGMYEGWYFAYYPWSYMPKAGTVKTVKVNPEQKSSNPNERISQVLHLSLRQFISANPEDGDIDQETGAINKTFSASQVLNVLKVETSAVEGSTFENEKGVLAGCEIESVTITADKDVFSNGELTIRAAKLPAYDDTKSEVENREALESSLRVADADECVLHTDFTNAVTTEVADGVYTVGDNASIYTLLVPATAELTDVVINVKADCGDFVIKYQDGEFAEGTPEKINNDAIQAIIDAYAEGGELTSIYRNDENGKTKVLSVPVKLYDEIFVPDFKNVTADNWAAKVTLANQLKLEEPEFELAENAEIVLSSKIKLPTNGVTVKGTKNNKFIVEKSYTWTEGLKLGDNKVKVEVATDAKLTVNSGAVIANDVTNDGVITVKKGATLGNKAKANLTNNKTVYVEFGGFVYPKSGKEGAIAYKVPKKYSLKTIDDMIGTGTAGSANVNTLEINSDVDLKCQHTTTTDPEGSDGNPYNPSAGTPGSSDTEVLDLSGINLWINGTGKVSATAPYAYKVKDVVMNGGELSGIDIAGNVTMNGTSTISDGDITGTVTVEGGEATISNGDIANDVTVKAGSIEISNGDVKSITADGTVTMSNGNVAGNVTLTSGESNFANVNIYGTLTIETAATANLSNATNAIKVKKIVNKGKLTSTNDINVEDIVADNCVIYLESTANAKDKVIWYSTTFEQIDGIELRGRILKAGTADLATATKKGQTIVLYSDLTNVEWSDLNPNDVDYILDLNGNTLDIIGEAKNLNASGDEMKKSMTIKNGVIKDAVILNAKNITFENVTFKVDYLENPNTPAIWWIDGNATFVNCKFESKVGRHLETISNRIPNATLTVTDSYFKSQPNTCPYFNPLGSKAKVVLTGNTFESGFSFDGLYGSETKYTVSGNKFEGTFGFSANVSDVSELTAKSKAFCNELLNNNDFLGTNKIDVYSTVLGTSIYVNAGF